MIKTTNLMESNAAHAKMHIVVNNAHCSVCPVNPHGAEFNPEMGRCTIPTSPTDLTGGGRGDLDLLPGASATVAETLTAIAGGELKNEVLPPMLKGGLLVDIKCL